MTNKRVQSHDMVFSPVNISFNVEAFDSLISSHAVTLVHYRAVLCPIGMDDRYDPRAHADHDDCSNGFVYKRSGEVEVFFSGNSSSVSLQEIGIMDGSSVQVTLSRYYTGSEREVSIQHHDRFYLKDQVAFSVNTQRFEAHQTGIDRLQYPALEIEDLIDANGNEYRQDHDFVLVDGHIKWLSQRRPGYNPELERGTICSVRYKYNPFWYVDRIIHEVRVSKDVDYLTGERSLVRMPYAVLLKREFVYENEERSKIGREDMRDTPTPRNGGFGPR